MEIRFEDGKLMIVVPCDAKTLEKAPPSASGKTRVVASTHGFAKYGPVGVSLNVTVPAKA